MIWKVSFICLKMYAWHSESGLYECMASCKVMSLLYNRKPDFTIQYHMIPNKIFYQYIFFFPLLVEMLSGKVGDSTNARFYDTIKKIALVK